MAAELKGEKVPHDKLKANTEEAHQHHLHVKHGDERLERHAGTGLRGTPKKGGAGGKHAWGRPGDEFDGPIVTALDENDPNYDEEEPQVLATDVREQAEHVADGPSGLTPPIVKKVVLD